MPKTKTKPEFQVEQNKEFLLNAPEISIFMSCCVLVNELRSLERSFTGGEMTKNAFLDRSNKVLGKLNETVDATERFDIMLPVMDYGRFSPFFWRWLHWWDDYFKGFTAGQIVDIE